MLAHLSIRNIVLIERLDLTFQRGLTVISGETGAGKSILLDSLELGLGERMSSSMLYANATEGSVSATFDVSADHPARLFLKECGVPIEDEDPLIFRRQVMQEGRSKAYISDIPVALGTLKQAASLLVEIQGQNSQIGLCNPAYHLPLLDHFSGLKKAADQTAQNFKAWSQAQQDLHDAEREILEAQKEEDWLRGALEDLEELNPQEGEELELSMTRNALQQNERRIESLNTALEELRPKDRKNSTPQSMIRACMRSLDRTSSGKKETEEVLESEKLAQEKIQSIIASLERAEEALCEAENDLEALSFDLQPDPQMLDQAEERLFALRAMARKHSTICDELPNLLGKLRDKLDTLESGVEKIELLKKKVKETRTHYLNGAKELSEKRKQSAKHLADALHKEFPALKLERAKFEVSFTEKLEEKWNTAGIEEVKFMVATNPGHPMEVLGKVASGGELSRMMLALRVVLAAKGNGALLVFDEIDSGVGGATATAIGQRLARIGSVMQTIAITHSPQVAASADHHIRISKKMNNNIMTTFLEPLDDSERCEEIARMIAGKTVTDVAREAAKSLISQSHSSQKESN